MKNLLYILIGALIISSCAQNSESETEDQSSIKTIEFTIEDLKKEDFKIIEREDTTFYLKQLYEGINGKEISYNDKDLKSVEARIKLNFSFVQYINDDNPASPISFRKESKWSVLKGALGQIRIPNFDRSTNSIQVHEALGFSTQNDLLEWIEKAHFEEIRTESFKIQTKLYQLILDTKEQYETCCPEYLEEAHSFLETKMEDYKTTEALGLELVYKELTIELTGELINGHKFRNVIIEK